MEIKFEKLRFKTRALPLFGAEFDGYVLMELKGDDVRYQVDDEIPYSAPEGSLLSWLENDGEICGCINMGKQHVIITDIPNMPPTG